MFPPENKEVSNEGMYNTQILHRSKLDIYVVIAVDGKTFSMHTFMSYS
jgi:hypothetical protein